MSVRPVSVAKDRLKMLILADRMQCAPKTAEMFLSDMYNTVSRYVDVSRENFSIKMTGSDIHIRIKGEKP